ncbi:MAG: PLP-dependent aminotransferase family protein [Candidatus Omnitrophica bacterium]|nr:PLP-dependent aminotransferase family protein [Candidatus Omnitrophota bacterium]
MVSVQNRQSAYSNATFNWRQRFSTVARRTLPPEINWLMAQALEDPDIISLAAGFVDQESLPHEEFAGLLREVMEQAQNGRAALQYGTTQGDLEFRIKLIDRLRREQVISSNSEIDASHCLVGSGSQQILYLAAEALLDEEDIVLLEAPTYFVVLGVFKSRGAQTIGIDTDEHGLIPERLEECLEQLKREKRLSRVKMLYLMSYATNPLGVTLPQERRRQILSILQRYRDGGFPILLVEDAAYRRLVIDGECPHPIKRFDDSNQQILYTESFSKSLSPGLRLGFGVGPKELIDKMIDIKGNHDFGSSNMAQQIIKTVMQSGLFDQHLKTLQSIYRRKRDIALNVLEKYFPPEAKWLRPSGGFYTWVVLPEAVDTSAKGHFFQTALQEKVLYVPGDLCYSSDRPESKRSSAMRLSYGMIGEQALQEGYKRLARAMEKEISTLTA